jgi:hypothetical protein
MDSWLTEQAIAWRSLRGSTITAWNGVEWAIDEEPDDVFRFAGSDLPFQQLLELGLVLNGGKNLVVGAYDPGQGLAAPQERPTREPWGAITRQADMRRLRGGRIDDVELRLGEADFGGPTIAEAVIVVEGERILVVAGELDDGAYTWMEESLLVLPHDVDADEITWAGGARSWTLLSEVRED